MSNLPSNKCGYCEKQSTDLKACSKCHLTPYCSKQCQRKDWDRHKQWCELLQGSFNPQKEDASVKHGSVEHGTPEGKRKKRKKKKSELDTKPSEFRPAENCVCNWCQKVCDETLRCSRCKDVTYCSQACQRKDWLDQHQKECTPFVPSQAATTTNSKSTTQDGTVNDSEAEHKSTVKEEVPVEKEEEASFVCERCQKYLDSPLRCSGCGKTAYCSEACQKKDWAHQHKKSCDKSKLKSKKANGRNKNTAKPKESVPNAEPGDKDDEDAEAVSMSCAWCQKFVDSPLKCSGCKNVVYCSGQCQKKDWITEHQSACKGTKPKEKLTRKTTSAATSDDSKEETGELSKTSDETDKEGCRACKKEVEDMKRCARCKIASYCSKSCQTRDWPRHKKECVTVDGVIKTKEYQKAERDAAAEREERFRQQQPMSPMEMMARMMGFWAGPEQQREATPRMSWAEARNVARVKYPGFTVVESFDDMPGEFLWMRPVSHNRVLLTFITSFHHYQARHAVYIRDVNREETFVMFYLDFDNPLPFFSWSQVTPGNYICIQNAVFHNFLDGTVGIRVDEASDVRIL